MTKWDARTDLAREAADGLEKHTPLPWHIESREFPYIVGANRQVIAEFPVTNQGRIDAKFLITTLETVKQRAQLLKATQEYLAMLDSTYIPMLDKLSAIRKLRSAVAAAEGRE